jgi:hypothetical protein
LNQRRDTVTERAPISYSEITERNIFDTRFTGCGKTTSALEYLHKVVVPEGQCVVVLMQSYERLENNYRSKFGASLEKHTLLFRGKTQEGLCKHSKKLRELSENGLLYKTACITCDDKDSCEYQKQLSELKRCQDSKGGCCILTTEKNLHVIFSYIGSRNPVLLIDDIPLSAIITPESVIPTSGLDALNHYLFKHKSKANGLYELSSLLSDYGKKKDSDILSFIVKNKAKLFGELERFKIGTFNEGDSRTPVSLKFISDLLYNTDKGKIHFYSEPHLLKIVIDATAVYKSNRVIYLNATPSLKDRYCIDQLGDVKTLEAKVEEAKRYFVFQISNSANTRQSILEPKKIKKDFLAMTGIIKNALSFTDQKLLLFTYKEAFQVWVNEGLLSGLSYSRRNFLWGWNTRHE